MARPAKAAPTKAVDPDQVADALARTVSDGDIVDFRLIFFPFSPARATSTEGFDDAKYAYLLPHPDRQIDPHFQRALEAVSVESTWAHILRELEANRPAQLPSDLLLLLADNAVRLNKWTSAAQAYELLRIRRKMQEEFFTQAIEALDRGDIPNAVRGFRIGAGLAYDYAAFPDPQPVVPNYQMEALRIHATYPMRFEECAALLEPEAHVQLALSYLLCDGEAAGRLRAHALEVRIAFLNELVRQGDPEWDTFVTHYGEACAKTQALDQRRREFGVHRPETLEEEIEDQRAEEPSTIPAALLGRRIPDGEWWQYLKELAYEHPASVLFVARQLVGEYEIVMPRLRADSPVPKALDLAGALDAVGAESVAESPEIVGDPAS